MHELKDYEPITTIAPTKLVFYNEEEPLNV